MPSPIQKLKSFFSQKKSDCLKKVRHIQIFKRFFVSVIYYRRSWIKSQTRKSLEENLRIFAQKYSDFNFLNESSAFLSRVFARMRLFPASRFFETLMQEKSGINRHVLFRYLMKELFLYFFVSFLFFFMIFFVNQILLVAESILKQRVAVSDVMRLIVYSLPMIIAQSAPFATLVGFLMCLGRLASENEILILRACAQSYLVILKPVLILGLLISLASFFVNDYLLPLGKINYNKLYFSIIMSNPSVALEPNSIKRTNDKTLVIGDVSGENVSDLVFFDNDSDGRARIIVAQGSSVKKSLEPGVLMKIVMGGANLLMFDRSSKNDYDILFSESLELNVFESTFLDDNRIVQPGEMTSYDLYKKIDEIKKDDETPPKTINRYNLEMSKKFSIPFGSIFFAFFALPFALLFGKHNGQTIGLIIGLFVAVLYWAVSLVGQIFSSRSGFYGSLTMWIPNLLVLISAFLAFMRLLRK